MHYPIVANFGKKNMRELLFWGAHVNEVGGERKIFENMESLDRWKWHFSEPSIPYTHKFW
jgi:hypothetical protein